METAFGVSNYWQKLFLYCGILAPIVYLGTDWLAGRLLKGYSFQAQSMSELSAVGSPVRPIVVSLTLAACLLMIAFGIGIWRAGGHELLPRIVAGLVIGNAVTGFIAAAFFPTRYGERPDFVSPNVLIMFLSVVCFVLAMIIGAVAFSGWLRMVSIAIPVAYVLLAGLRFAKAAASAADQSESLIGAQERTMGYSFLLWVIALAIYLLLLFRQTAAAASGNGG